MQYHWLSQLVQPRIALKKYGTSQWFIGAGCIADSIGLGWPATRRGDCFIPDTSDTATGVFISILDHNQWRAAPIEPISPLHSVLHELSGGQPTTKVDLPDSSACTKHQIVGMLSGKEGSLLDVAAREAFWHLPLAWLKQLAELIDAPGPHDSLISCLETLVKTRFPLMKNDQVMQILQKRELNLEVSTGVGAIEDVLGLEYVLDIYDEEEREAVKIEIEAAKKSAGTLKQYKSSFTEWKAARNGRDGGEGRALLRAELGSALGPAWGVSGSLGPS